MSGEQPGSAKLLNPNQRRGLATTLSVLEEMLCEIERTLTGGGYKGVLFELRDDVPSPVKGEILKRISLIKERIEAVAEQFVLSKRSSDASSDFMGKLAYGWEILVGAKARYQRGYGTVAEGLAEVLDPQLDDILVLLDGVRDLVTGEKKE
jgi:hypothetical protein